jgi:hypothetical protein
VALSLGIKAGVKIQVGESVVEIRSITPPALIVVSVDGGPDMVVSDQARQELMPHVFAFTGAKDGTGNRIAIEAPRDIKITRMKDAA